MLQPHPKSPGLEVGVTAPMIRRLVHGFYAQVRLDRELGPVFAAHVKDWEEHLDKMCAFWSSVTLMTGDYKGRPMEVHARIPEISDALFLRWLQLFQRAAREQCPPEAASLFIDRASRIAESLKLGIAIRRQSGCHVVLD
jgi:hemoglobin